MGKERNDKLSHFVLHLPRKDCRLLVGILTGTVWHTQPHSEYSTAAPEGSALNRGLLKPWKPLNSSQGPYKSTGQLRAILAYAWPREGGPGYLT